MKSTVKVLNCGFRRSKILKKGKNYLMTMDLDMTKTINNFLVNVALTNVVVTLFVKVLGGESIKNLEKVLISNFFKIETVRRC